MFIAMSTLIIDSLKMFYVGTDEYSMEEKENVEKDIQKLHRDICINVDNR